MYAGLITAGFSALQSMYGTSVSNSVANIKAGAENRIRDINHATVDVVNQRNAALTSLQRWAQGVRNERVYEGLGNNQAAAATNFNRMRDARTRQNFATNVQQAEASGRMQAAAAASGVTGSVVDILNQATALKVSMAETARVSAEKQMTYDYRLGERQQTFAAYDQLDTGLIFDNPELYDYSRSVATTRNEGIAGLASFGASGGFSSIGNLFGSGASSSGGDSLGAFLALNDNFSYK